MASYDGMTPQEAIKRIENHNEIHSKNENFAFYITKALNMGIKALEKQIPKRPLKKTLANDGYAWEWVCPNCHIVKITTEHCFCNDCGQALDWSDTE